MQAGMPQLRVPALEGCPRGSLGPAYSLCPCGRLQAPSSAAVARRAARHAWCMEHSLGAVHAGHLPLRTLGGCPSHWQAWPAWQGSEDPMRNLTIDVLAWQACRAWDTPGGACPIVLSPLPRQLPVAKDHTTQAPYVSDNVIPQPWHSGIHCKLVAAWRRPQHQPPNSGHMSVKGRSNGSGFCGLFPASLPARHSNHQPNYLVITMLEAQSNRYTACNPSSAGRTGDDVPAATRAAAVSPVRLAGALDRCIRHS